MGYWKNQFDKIARKAIANYAKFYGVPEDTMNIGMLLAVHQGKLTGEVQFWTLINRQYREEIPFLKIYHGPKARFDITGMTILIPKFIAKAMVRIVQQHRLQPDVMSVRVHLDKGETFLFLMDGTRMVKLLSEEEIFDDEQIAVDAAQEVMA